MADILKIAAAGLAVLLLLFVLMLYIALHTRVTDVSDKKPYPEVLGKSWSLQRPATLSLSLKHEANASAYLLTELDIRQTNGTLPRYTLPIGTVLKLKQAKLFKNGVSGFERAFVLGTVFVPELKAEVAFEYEWADTHTSITGNEKDHYTFPLAVWQGPQDRVFEGQFSY